MTPSPTDLDPPNAKAFLKAAARPGRRPVALASLSLVLDAVFAVGFAAGLVGSITHLSGGVAAVEPWLALLLAAAAARAVAGLAATRFAASAARLIKSALRRRVLTAVLDSAASRCSAGEASAAVIDQIEALDGYVVRYLPARAMATAGPVIVLAFAVLASPLAAGLLLATLVPFIILMALAGGAAASASRNQLDALAKLSGIFADRVRSLPLLLAFQAEDRATTEVAAASRQVAERTLLVLRIAFISTAGLEFFAALSVALVAVYAGFRLLGLMSLPFPDGLTFARAFFVLALAPEFYAPMRRLAAAYHERQLGEAAAEALRVRLALAGAPATPAAALAAAPALRFDQVVIGFADDPDFRIGPVDFEARAGSITALVGPTGSGKSSLLRLLTGEAALASGAVTVDGTSMTDMGGLVRSIAWAGQAPAILPGSLRWNIALASPDASGDAIERAAINAGLSDVLGRRGGLSLDLDERGSGLSGGERRRIGLARAFLKNAPVLILDEPTADLDAASEAAMIAAIRRAARGRTVLIATHSAALAGLADQVIEL